MIEKNFRETINFYKLFVQPNKSSPIYYFLLEININFTFDLVRVVMIFNFLLL